LKATRGSKITVPIYGTNKSMLKQQQQQPIRQMAIAMNAMTIDIKI
jgi:hypothetical protein